MNFVELEAGRGDDVEQVHAAAVLLKSFDHHLSAAETHQFGLDERIFLLKRVNHGRAVADVRGAVVDEHLLFLGFRDDRVAILRRGERRETDNNQQQPSEAYRISPTIHFDSSLKAVFVNVM